MRDVLPVNLSASPPLVLFTEMARSRDGTQLALAHEHTALDQILQAIGKGERLPELLIDAVRRMPILVRKLGVRLSTVPQLQNAVESSPSLLAQAAAFRWDEWGELAKSKLPADAEMMYRFLDASRGTTTEVASFLPLLARCPFWARRACELNSEWREALLSDSQTVDADDPDPYRRLHFLVTHPFEPCRGSWHALFSNGVTMILAAQLLHKRGFPWDMIPCTGLGPRESFNLLQLWRGNNRPPFELWLNLAPDPEWLVAAWRLPGALLPRGAPAQELFDRTCDLCGGTYVYGDIFDKWLRKNAPLAGTGSSKSGGDEPEQEH